MEKAREFQKNDYFCFTAYIKAVECVDHNKLWKFLKKWEYQTTLHVSWETCIRVKKQQLEPDMKQLTGSKLGNEYIKAAYCHSAYLIYMHSTSCEMPGWMNHNLEQECQEKYQQPQICRWHHSRAQSEEELKSPKI